MTENEILHLKHRLETRLNNHLVDMKPNYDDSITGFNDAWDIMREMFEKVLDEIVSEKPI